MRIVNLTFFRGMDILVFIVFNFLVFKFNIGIITF